MRFFILNLLLPTALAADILSSSGFTNCNPNADIRVNHANITFDRSSGTIFFDVSGTSTKVQNVSAELIVTAYGKQVYNNAFNPCEKGIKQLCPVPQGTFGANGSQVIPENFLSQIPGIAFSIPDLDGQATLKLTGDGNSSLGCIQAGVTNGKTVNVPAIPYVAAGIAIAALALSGFAALGTVGVAGAPAPAVSFSTVVGWFQTMQMNGMHSVNYPPVYRAFAKNFAFSGGLVPWDGMQIAIDRFRGSTGGNLTIDSVAYLRSSTLVINDGSSGSSKGLSFVSKRSLQIRDITTTSQASANNTGNTELNNFAHGIGAYVQQLTIPQSNTFMTVLIVFAIIIAAIAVGILLLKVILEAWALFGSFPKRLTSFRKRYWLLLAKTITQLILLLYGVWVLYCIFQFRNGDSWAAKVLAGVTLATFTAILAFFAIKIVILARKYKKAEGDSSALYDNKETWLKYSLFYDAYRQGYWWLFIPAIIYMFAKGCVLAAGDGHGLTQTSGQLIIEALMLILLLWTRPFATRSSQIINIFIQVVRVLSVVCILIFVEELGIAQTTQTITGVVLVAVQAGLTGLLAILIAINAIILCCRENPHRKKRKEAERLNRDLDTLTPLDARNSLLMLQTDISKTTTTTSNSNSTPPATAGKGGGGGAGYQLSPYENKGTGYSQSAAATGSTEHLLAHAGSLPSSEPAARQMTQFQHQRPYTPSLYSDHGTGDRLSRQPTLPPIFGGNSTAGYGPPPSGTAAVAAGAGAGAGAGPPVGRTVRTSYTTTRAGNGAGAGAGAYAGYGRIQQQPPAAGGGGGMGSGPRHGHGYEQWGSRF